MEKFFSKEIERTYFKIPFEVLDDVSKLEIEYDYIRHENGEEINIIDIGVEAPMSNYIGWSGSNRKSITISENGSSQGYANAPIEKGTWNIIIGAYKISDKGVLMSYNIKETAKKRQLFFGDTHIHTICSDGVLSIDEITKRALLNKLDYIIITDHNNYSHNFTLNNVEGLTIIEGTEWTHYNGHAGMIGVKKPFEVDFICNTKDEVIEKFNYAKSKGSLISISHPCCEYCGFKWGLDGINYDTIEVWNGPMTKTNENAINLWNDLLLSGKKKSIIAGSDFHRPELFRDLGMPTTAVFAMSQGKTDILDAIKNGNSYLSYTKDGPIIDSINLGETVLKNKIINVTFKNLNKNDKIKIIYNGNIDNIDCDISVYEYSRKLIENGFIRFEVLRNYISEDKHDIVSLSNAIYIEDNI